MLKYTIWDYKGYNALHRALLYLLQVILKLVLFRFYHVIDLRLYEDLITFFFY